MEQIRHKKSETCLWGEGFQCNCKCENCKYYLPIEEEDDIEEIIEQNRREYYKYYRELQKQMED